MKLIVVSMKICVSMIIIAFNWFYMLSKITVFEDSYTVFHCFDIDVIVFFNY